MNKKKMLMAASVLSAAAVPSLRPASAPAAMISSIYSGGVGVYSGLSGEVTALLNSSSATSTTFVLTDSSGSVLCYNIAKTNYGTGASLPAVGDDITISSIGNAGYQGAPELTNTNLSAGNITVVSQGNAVPTPPGLTVPQFMAAGTGSVTETALAPYAEALVTLDNVSFTTDPSALVTSTTYGLTDAKGDTTSLYAYKSDSNVAASVPTANAANPGGFTGTYDITGYVDVYYGAPEIYPTSIIEVSSSAVPEPATFGLLGAGSLAMLARRRRRA